MTLLSNILRTDVTELTFLFEKPSLKSNYIGNIAHLFTEVLLPLF